MSGRNIQAWKQRAAAAKAVERALPSGSVIEQRRVSLSALMSRGVVPQSFFEASEGKAKKDMTDEEKEQFKREAMQLIKNDPKALAEMSAFARVVAKDSVTWPLVIDNTPAEIARAAKGTAEFVTVDDIPVDDLFDIMNYALNEAPVMTTSGEVPAEAINKTGEVEHVQSGGGDVENVRAVSG